MVNLTDLNYEAIRLSLLEYLKKQDKVRDLNFEGSAVNFLLDLLAYNTLYYAHFANMISTECFLDSAQLERSVISLVKPLGYVVPSKTSSIARIKASGITSVDVIEPFALSVKGRTPEGSFFDFWNIDPITVAENDETSFFSVYEGTYNELNYGGDGFDYPEQQIFIPNLNLDVKTIRVLVKRIADTEYSYWNFLDTYSDTILTENTNLYTIERTTGGFIIKFKLKSSGQNALVEGDEVKIQFLTTNGTFGNNCSSFTKSTFPYGDSITIQSPSSSFGGLDTPNLTDVKKFAPLIFSAQRRLVSKYDYYAYLAQLGYVSGVNVWGGEENTPPILGRVFFSVAELGNANNDLVKNIIGKMKERSVVTILPEYIAPVSLNVNFTLTLTYDSSVVQIQPEIAKNLIKEDIISSFGVLKFNKSFNQFNELSSAVSKYPGYNFTLDQNINLTYTVSPSTKQTTLSFKNSIKKYDLGGGIYSSSFLTNYDGAERSVFIRDKPIFFPNAVNPPSIGKLKLFAGGGDQIQELDAVVGEINYQTGTIIIYPNIFNTQVTINVLPDNTTSIISKDEVYLTLNITT